MSELDYSPEVAIPTFVGSIVSFIATSCILLSYVRYHAERKSFRHALVLNLAIAGWQSMRSTTRAALT